MSPNEDRKLYKEIIQDILCIAPKYGKEIAGKVFGKSLKCGNIFMHLEEEPNVNNKISLNQKKINLEYQQLNYFIKNLKNLLEQQEMF